MANELGLLPSIRDILHKYDIAADKKLGQNFLFDLNLTDKIARSAGNINEANILEIGPGPGALTRSLLNAGAIVTAIEMDKKCINALNGYLAPAANRRLSIINGDALDIRNYSNLPEKIMVVANLPYNISTALLTMWLDRIELFSGFTLMFQKEVADRIMSQPNCKEYGRLSVKTQWQCDVRHEFDLPPEAFFPAPKVTSSVITITPRQFRRGQANAATLERVCKAAFGQRRKTLRVSLKQISTNPQNLLARAGIDDSRRPEDLSIEEFCAISREIEAGG
jgi:16S rRNA (adenine1518-N6/adenine1519-N6)-dimethyltransferase